MTTAKKLLTADDLLAMPDAGKRYELIRGVLIEMPPTSHQSGRIADLFSRRTCPVADIFAFGPANPR